MPIYQLRTNNSFGFTLIELLVVITIIGILSAVGMTIYSGVQKRAQDTKKKADINAIATAYELNYNRKEQKYPILTADNVSGEVLNSPDYKDSCLLKNPAPAFEVCIRLSDGKEHCRQSIYSTPQKCRIPTQAGQRTPPCDEYGDVNGDTWVTSDDATMIQQSIVGGFTALTCPQKQKADVTADGKIDISDATRVDHYVKGQQDNFDVCSKGSQITC